MVGYPSAAVAVATHTYWKLPLPPLADSGDESPISSLQPVSYTTASSGTDFWRLPFLPLDTDSSYAELELYARDASSAAVTTGDAQTSPPRHLTDASVEASTSPPRGLATAASTSQSRDLGAATGLEAPTSLPKDVLPRWLGGEQSRARPEHSREAPQNAVEAPLEATCDENGIARLSFMENCVASLQRARETPKPLGTSEDAISFDGVLESLPPSLMHTPISAVQTPASFGDAGCLGCLPPVEISRRVFIFLDVQSLVRGACACAEWARIGRAKGRWKILCEADWSLIGGSRKEYRKQLEKWREMKSTLAGLKGKGYLGNSFGSSVRRQLIRALQMLCELSVVATPSAAYPSNVPALVRETGAIDTLLTLLDDESPHLLCLAVRCLADLAVDEAHRHALCEGMEPHLASLRTHLEGHDMELKEASARVLLNLRSEVPGAPLNARRRGPMAFCNARRGGAVALAASWTGVWVGEIRYARDGSRHASLALSIGHVGDPAVERAGMLLEQQGIARGGCVSSGGGASSSSSSCASRQSDPEDLWRSIGLLARATEETSSGPTLSTSLYGAGWEERSGAFAAELRLPTVAEGSSTTSGASTALSPAVPLCVVLRYTDRMCLTELTCFLTEGRNYDGECIPVLYGVHGVHGGATMVGRHRHLFALRRVCALPTAAACFDGLM